MSNQPFLSVIVPIYNASKYLPACLDSIFAQTFTDYEILLIDDGSTDESGAICDRYAGEHSRARVIHQTNKGLVAARVTGLEASKGTYIAFVDSDDWIEPDMYADLCRIAQDTDADIVHSDFIAAMPDRRKKCGIPFAPGYYDKDRLISEVYPKMIYSGVFFVFGAAPNVWNKLFKRDLLAAHLPKIPPTVRNGEDGLLTYTCLLSASSVYFTDKAYYYFRSVSNSMSHSIDERRLNEMHLLFDVYRQLIDTTNYPIIEKQLSYFFAYQSLLTLPPIFRFLKENKTLSRAEKKQQFLAECSNPHIRLAFQETPIREIAGKHNKLYAFCLRHRLYQLFMCFI